MLSLVWTAAPLYEEPPIRRTRELGEIGRGGEGEKRGLGDLGTW